MIRSGLVPPSLLICAVLVAYSGGAVEEGASTGKKKDDRYPAAVSLKESGESALKKFSVASGLQVDLWAAEPLLANPVAFCFDDHGRAYVAETYRRRTSVPDIRKFEPWQMENFALRTVADRERFLMGKFPVGAHRLPTKELADFNQDGSFDYTDWGIESERVKLLVDSTGSGKADRATVFATLKSTPVSGVGAGVVARGGSVFYTCVPDLWRFDGERDGVAQERNALLTGFGVHVAYGGHDMHGTKFGPDGRLYWSIADCGARVETKEGALLDCPDSGAVFRSDADGSNAELVAVGLRNPQSLAFNELGDLFTGDNNADGGDKARWTHIVDGADYGWRIGWQFLNKTATQPQLGAWNGEGMWALEVGKTNPAVLPPVGLIGHGPAGIAYYPGTGLPETYRDHFFMTDFPGGVRSFQLTARGASYTVENPHEILQDNAQKNMTGKLLWGLFPSDVEFGVDGGAYVLDWVQGWDKTGKGRIFRVHDPATDGSALVQETKKLLAEGMAGKDEAAIRQYLGHPDQRVRLATQEELVSQVRKSPPTGLGALVDMLLHGKVMEGRHLYPEGPPSPEATHRELLARLHALWGLGELYRENRLPNLLQPNLISELTNPAAELRAQAAKVLGSPPRAPHEDAIPALIKALLDPAPRVRFFAAQSLGKLGAHAAVPALLELLKTNANDDAFIRHAAVVSLSALADLPAVLAHADDPADPVRTGVLLILRRQARPEIARFLEDKNPQIVLDAARAIHDGAIPAAWPQLAAMATRANLPPPLLRRVLNANYLLGTAEAAERLGSVASTAGPAAPRLEAMECLRVWTGPFQRDRITGLWRDLPATRDMACASRVAAQIVPALLNESDESLQRAAAELAGSLKVSAAEPFLLATATNGKASGEVRAAALQALSALGSAYLSEAVQSALASGEKTLLTTARRLAGQASPALALKVNAKLLGKGSVREQQAALATIAAQNLPEADKVLSSQLDLLAAGHLPAALRLDLLEAAALRESPEIKQKLAAFEASRPTTDPLEKWRDCLQGGDAKAGRTLFAEKAEAACMRCHKVRGEGGDVGPDLAGIGQRHDRDYILQSIVDPNAVIAPGYESVVLTLKDGQVLAGLLNAETPDEVTLGSFVDGKKQQVKKADIKERASAPSVMPPGLADALGKRGLRDVIEYLATVK